MQNLLERAQKIHLIGIGGIGMSALAQILNSQNKKITGSDQDSSPITAQLEKQGIEISYSHDPNFTTTKPDLVIHSNAITSQNPEIIAAKNLNIPIINLGQALGFLSEDKFTIAVCGTHGKSTTTALGAMALINNNLDPTVFIGTKLKEFELNNVRIGKSNYMLIEACEYKRNFLHLHPNIIIITNIEKDHLDYFKDEEDYTKAFEEFIESLPKNGIIIANKNDKNTVKIAERHPEKTIFYDNTDPANPQINLQIPGTHNQTNALAIIKLSEALQLNQDKTIEALENFTGSWRRFETKGKLGETTIIDDYAHHPTEIKATLQAAHQKHPKAKILAVFQPHQFSRTHKLLDQFSNCFADADTVIIPNIYSVRDTQADLNEINQESFVNFLQKTHPKVINGENLEETTDFIKKNYQNWDLILIMGAGDVYKISEKLLS